MTDRNVTFEVDRSDLTERRLKEEDLAPLEHGQVRLRVDRFALTSNNVTYGVFGDVLGYWDFFPAEQGWGRIPAMGWADVIESENPEVQIGGRYYGWFPMSRYVTLTAGAIPTGLRDDGEHRQAHAPVYRTYVESGQDPWYEAGDDAENRHALLRGLFLTGLLADAFFADTDYSGASAAVVLSASSKTAIGFAICAAQREGVEVVGLTSARNAGFVKSLGCYDTVLAYADLTDIPSGTAAVSIDMAGDSGTLAALHAHLGDRLRYSMIVGNSHHGAPAVEITAGPAPQLFFAPTEVTRRQEAWGQEEYARRTTSALSSFVDHSRGWLSVERHDGPNATVAAFGAVFDGSVAPNVGVIASLHT